MLGRGGCDGALTVLSERVSGAATAAQARFSRVGWIAIALRVVVLAVGIIVVAAPPSVAQICTVRCPNDQPVPGTAASTDAAAISATFDLTSRYLQMLGGMGPGSLSSLFGTGPNPGGGGAPAAPAAPRWRAWTELYGLASKTGAQGDFPGDSRRSYGGVAGLALNVAPGAMIGLSVDQSRTKIDITGLPQNATLDLTQVGINGAYEWGAWTFSAAGVTGFAGIGSDRDMPSGPAIASYHAQVWGVIGEASYYIPLGSSRIVPKFGADWTRTHADAYAEIGGIDAVMVPAAIAERTRVFAGTEIGNTWVLTNTVFDLSAYARAVDIVQQRVPDLTVSAVSGPATPVTVFGVSEARFGVETGVAASLRLSPLARLYVLYDGRFRDGFHSNGGTLGVELRW